MSGLPPVPVPQRERDEGLRWPFLLIGLVVGASIITGGVLAFRGWKTNPTSATAPVPTTRFRADVPIRIESTKRIPMNNGSNRKDMLLCRVTVTNNSGAEVSVSVTDVQVVSSDRQVHTCSPFAPPPQFGEERLYGRSISELGARILPGGSASGDVSVYVEPGAAITQIGLPAR